MNQETEREQCRLRRVCVAVIGDARVERSDRRWTLAMGVGAGLVDRGYCVLTGGLGGVMEAACLGARQSTSWCAGTTIGLLPGTDPGRANPYVDIPLATGLDHGRNQIVAQASAVIAIGGGAGTLSELAFAWIHRRLIIGLRCGGWSERLADERIDERIRYREIPDDRVYGADTAEEALVLLDRNLERYSGRHREIR